MEQKQECKEEKDQESLQTTLKSFKSFLLLMNKVSAQRNVIVDALNKKMKSALSKRNNLMNALGKASAQQKKINHEKEERLSFRTSGSQVVSLVVFGLLILSQTQGFCDVGNNSGISLGPLGGSLDFIEGVVHHQHFKKVAMSVTGIIGIGRAWKTGSPGPIGFWVLIGLTACAIQPAADFLSKIR